MKNFSTLHQQQNTGFNFYWNWPTVSFFSWKFNIFSQKLYNIFVLYILSCYTTFIAHTFHIKCIQNKTHGRGPLINSYSHRHLSQPLHLQPGKYMGESEYIFLFCTPCVYCITKKIRKQTCFWLRSYFHFENLPQV